MWEQVKRGGGGGGGDVLSFSPCLRVSFSPCLLVSPSLSFSLSLFLARTRKIRTQHRNTFRHRNRHRHRHTYKQRAAGNARGGDTYVPSSTRIEGMGSEPVPSILILLALICIFQNTIYAKFTCSSLSLSLSFSLPLSLSLSHTQYTGAMCARILRQAYRGLPWRR